MTDLGFKVHNRFYPLVTFPDWTNKDFVLARKLTGISTDEMLGPNADSMLLQQTLVAIAISHERRELRMDQVIDFIYDLKPTDMEEVGFEFVDEGDARPPDAGTEDQSQSNSSESSNSSTDAPQETGTLEPSGEPGSDIGSQESPQP